jgi:hypothetical protein
MDDRGVSGSGVEPDPAAGAEPTYFTLEHANRTLPLVRRIVADIVAAYPALQRRTARFHELAADHADPQLNWRLEALREEIDREAARINGFVAELTELGCSFKGFEEGLVDFPSHHDGRTILLCWKLGEEEIGFWHELDTGYAGRQPLAALGAG